MNVNVTRVRVDIPAAIESRLKPLKPQDAMCNWRSRLSLPCEPHRPAAFKDGAWRIAPADLLRHPMQSQRRPVRPRLLARAKARSRHPELAAEEHRAALRPRPDFEQPHRLLRDTHGQHETAQGHVQKPASPQKSRRKQGPAFHPARRGVSGAVAVRFLTSTLDLRPLCSYFSRRAGGKSSAVPSANPPFDWK